jgi:hypothetical protein
MAPGPALAGKQSDAYRILLQYDRKSWYQNSENRHWTPKAISAVVLEQIKKIYYMRNLSIDVLKKQSYQTTFLGILFLIVIQNASSLS